MTKEFKLRNNYSKTILDAIQELDDRIGWWEIAEETEGASDRAYDEMFLSIERLIKKVREEGKS